MNEREVEQLHELTNQRYAAQHNASRPITQGINRMLDTIQIIIAIAAFIIVACYFLWASFGR